MKTKFAPASDTLAVMTLRGTTEPVAKLAVTADCVLLTLIVSIVRGILTPYRESHISLKAGQTVYFVQSEREGYSYIVFLYADGTSLCSCKDGCAHRHCSHVDDAASYEARCQEIATPKFQKAQKNLLSRTELKNGTVLYVFQSSTDPDYRYFITAKNGVMDSATHRDCIGFRCSKYGCGHADVVNAMERPTFQARADAETVRADAMHTEYKNSAYYKKAFAKQLA